MFHDIMIDQTSSLLRIQLLTVHSFNACSMGSTNLCRLNAQSNM